MCQAREGQAVPKITAELACIGPGSLDKQEAVKCKAIVPRSSGDGKALEKVPLVSG